MVHAGRFLGKRPAVVPLAAILALAGFLRLFGLQNGQYGSDDERLWSLALRALARRQPPGAGIISSIGTANGPFQVYLVMPAAALFAHAPLAGAVIVALVNAASVYFLYRLIDEFFGRRPALIAALLFATSSWAIIYARRMQGQDMLVPFQILFFWFAARWLARGRTRDLVLMFVWLSIMSQMYILGLLHVLAAAVILMLGWRRLRPLPLIIGVGVAALLAIPYMATALLPGLGGFHGMLSGKPSIDAQSLILALTMATHKGFQTIAGQAGSVFDSTSGVEAVLVLAEEALFAAGFGYLLARLGALLGLPGLRSWRLAPSQLEDKRQAVHAHAVLLLWALLPTLLFTRHSVTLYPYYFVAVLPLPAVFTALLLDALWRRGGAIALGLLAANSVALAGIFFAVIPGYFTKADYGLPYHYTFDTAPKIEDFVAQHHLGRVYVDGDMDPSEVMSSVLTRDGVDVFWFDDYRTPEFAAPPLSDPPALYVTMADDTATARFLRDQFAARQALAFPLLGEGVTIRGYVLQPAEVRQALDRLLNQPLQIKAQNGILLGSFHGDPRLTPGRQLQAAVDWTWTGGQRPGQTHYSIFAHLVDASGKAVAEVDNPLQPTIDWRQGQRVIQWLDLALPTNLAPGRYSLDLGVYGQTGVVRQSLSDANGKQLGGSLTLGPFVVPPPPAAAGSATGVKIGDGIELLSHQTATAGGKLDIDLVWTADSQPSKDYTVFVHVLDSSGKVVAQADSQPRQGQFPTSVWRPGDRIDDRYSLAVPPGHYTIEAGMYQLATLQRLPGSPVTFPVDT